MSEVGNASYRGGLWQPMYIHSMEADWGLDWHIQPVTSPSSCPHLDQNHLHRAGARNTPLHWALMTSAQLHSLPSSQSASRGWPWLTSKPVYHPHWTSTNLPTASTGVQKMPSLRRFTLPAPTSTTIILIWKCCSSTSAQHSTPSSHPNWWPNSVTSASILPPLQLDSGFPNQQTTVS